MSSDADTSIVTGVAAYYSSRLAQHGATPRGVDWNGQASQDTRHRQFLRLLDGEARASVLDLGCGYGDFLRFLRAEGHHGPYIGYDVADNMIAEATRLHGEGADRQWRVGANPDDVADFAVASGILNVKGDVALEPWESYVRNTVDVLARCGRRGFAFNVLSLSSDPERRTPNLYYADPGVTLSYCLRRYGRSVALLQDYGLYEFTVIVRKV